MRPLSRTLFVLVPLHVVAFVALYFGVVRIVRREISAAYTDGARFTLFEVVNDLHPAMEGGDAAKIKRRLAAFVARHRLLELQLFASDGSQFGQPGTIDPGIAEFLRLPRDERFVMVERGASRILEGTQAIVATDGCQPCHESGRRLGAVTIRLDLTEVITEIRTRARSDLILLISAWAVVVGLLNVVLVRVTRRAVRRLQTGETLDAARPTAAMDRRTAVVMDPVALELYSSLSDTLARQLREREEAADRMHRSDQLASLGQLAAGLAHEIRNPLAGIHSVVELLGDEATNDRTREIYAQILSELSRVNTTLQTLLTFARPSRTHRVQTDIAALLEEAAVLLRPALAQRSITLELDFAADLTPVAVDPSQLRQIVLNLVNNAADAVGGSGRIRIAAAPLPVEEGVILEVEDDGPGIPEEHVKKIFEPFFTTKFTGTGLGLAVVRSLVAQHGGRIEVESWLGHGTRFFVTIPSRPYAPSAGERT